VALLCACAMALGASPAAAEPSGEPLPTYDGDLTFPAIESLADPGEYCWRVEFHDPGDTLQSISDTEAAVVHESGVVGMVITTEKAHDAHGTEVPTTLEVSEGDVLTLVVHHREGAYIYPVQAGEGFPWSDPTIVTGPPDEAELAAAKRRVEEANPPAPTLPPPTVSCTVPALRGLSLRGAKLRLRAAHCGIGQVHLAGDATAGTGKVVKQFHLAGTELPAGAPVAVKLGPPLPRD
jgi:hypothetical protein